MWISRKKYLELLGRVVKLEEGMTIVLDLGTKNGQLAVLQNDRIKAALTVLGKSLGGQWWTNGMTDSGLEAVRVASIFCNPSGDPMVDGERHTINDKGYYHFSARVPLAEFAEKFLPTHLTDEQAKAELAKLLRGRSEGLVAMAKSLEPEVKKEEKPAKRKWLHRRVTLPSYDAIRPYIEKKLISEQVHPEEPALRIFNYTHVCQFERAWDDVTRQCRGLILNVDTGEVVANPFPKFFNYEEHLTNGWQIPDETPIITEKYDGSLGILYHLHGRPWIATRGSFTSDQAQWATAWYRENVSESFVLTNKATHLFEILYAENRIVVSYDFEGLVYLGSRCTETGKHADASELWTKPFRIARRIPPTDLAVLAAADAPNSEGFVVFYSEANTRVKVKFHEYVRLHKILTGLSEIGVWEHLRAGKTLDLEKVPDEFMAWVDEVQGRITTAYGHIEEGALADYASCLLRSSAGHASPRKELALLFRERRHPNLLFAILDGKDYSDTIWRMVRPSGARQFTTDPDA